MKSQYKFAFEFLNALNARGHSIFFNVGPSKSVLSMNTEINGVSYTVIVPETLKPTLFAKTKVAIDDSQFVMAGVFGVKAGSVDTHEMSIMSSNPQEMANNLLRFMIIFA